MSTYLITGATSGLGLQVALRLAHQSDNHLILPVRDREKGDALRQRLHAVGRVQLSTPLLDLASLPNVAAFLKAFDASYPRALNGVLLNAGVQSANRIEFTEDGYGTTFVVNHLANYLLARGLLGRLASLAVVGWTASNAYDLNERSARLAGFRGAQYNGVARLAKGDYGENHRGNPSMSGCLCHLEVVRHRVGSHLRATLSAGCQLLLIRSRPNGRYRARAQPFAYCAVGMAQRSATAVADPARHEHASQICGVAHQAPYRPVPWQPQRSIFQIHREGGGASLACDRELGG